MNQLVILKTANESLKPITWLNLILLQSHGPLFRKENALDEFRNTIKMECNRFVSSSLNTPEPEIPGLMQSVQLKCRAFRVRNILIFSRQMQIQHSLCTLSKLIKNTYVFKSFYIYLVLVFSKKCISYDCPYLSCWLIGLGAGMT